MDEEEVDDQYTDGDEYEPSEQEIIEYCEWLGMDPETDKVLSWIAREALKAPLPENWKICYTEDREVYYFNVRTGESIWDHPMDAYYKALFRQEKVKLEKKRRKMRLFSGSFAILPLQDYYNDLVEDPGKEENCTIVVPDHLIDPIDLRIFIDPVVLPTSGRTVSKHTIVNNKWRDPFSREYIENRRLIPNVDKRNEVATWLEATTVKHFEAITESNTFHPLLRLLPYILDKECEVSLKAQTLVLGYVQKLFDMPAPEMCKEVPSPQAATAQGAYGNVRRNGRRLNKTTPRAAARISAGAQCNSNGESDGSVASGSSGLNQPRPPPFVAPTDSNSSSSRGYYELMQLSDEEANLMIGCLLTMSTTASIETLYLILDAVPQFRCVPVFRGFSPEVLNALHLSPSDMEQIQLAALAETPSVSVHDEDNGTDIYDASGERGSTSNDHRTYNLQISTSNSEFVVQLKWIVLLMDYPNHFNILEKFDWSLALHLVILIVNSCSEVLKTRTTLICRLLRGLEGWPGRLKECPSEVIQWLIRLTLMDSNPWNQILLIYDLLVNGGEPAIENIKLQKSIIVESLFAASASDSGQGITYASMLGALLVFQDCFKLSDFSHNKVLEMSIASDLLPRLTRQQWKPKHFEHTINCVMASIKKDPDKAWKIMGGKATAFLIKELSKKKKNCEDLQTRLENIEATERQLESVNSVANWALLYLKLHRMKQFSTTEGTTQQQEMMIKLIEQHERSKAQVEQDRVHNLVVVLQTLLSVRLKPKQHRDRDRDAAKHQSLADALGNGQFDRYSRNDHRAVAGNVGSALPMPSLSFSRGRRCDKFGKDATMYSDPCSPPSYLDPPVSQVAPAQLPPRTVDQGIAKSCSLPRI